MWIYLNDAMLSIVQNTGRQDQFLVRARFPGDIERCFPDAVTYETNDADYRFRAFIGKMTVAELVMNRLVEIGYDNFKSTVTDPRRRRWYGNTWTEAVEAQRLKRMFPNEQLAVKPPEWEER